MARVVAWVAILVASNLLNIVWRLLVHRDAPLWTLLLRAGIIVALLAVASTRPDLRPLRGFLIALVAVTVGLLLKDLVYQYRPLADWARQAPWRDPVVVSSAAKMIPAAALALTVIGLSRQQLFLVTGDLSATGRVPFLDQSLPWTILGPIVIGIFGASSALFLTAALQPLQLQRIVPFLPVILVFSAINAFAEEFTFRSVLLARLLPGVGAETAVWMTAVRFGLGHWFGSPPGPLGTLGATLLGLMLGKSMIETGGFMWAWSIHTVLDVIIFSLLIAGGGR